VPDKAAETEQVPPSVIVSKPEPCDPRASQVLLLHFVLPGGGRMHQSIEWTPTENGTYRVDVRPAFATCVVDPTGATLDSTYFGVPGHP
jgi:hypothetical protein